MIQTLTSELEHVCESLEMDFSSVQLIAAWIADALAQLPNTLATEAQHQLAPLRSSLTLTSGKVMTEIWSACLPFQPTTPAIADAYRKLLDRGVTSFGEVWEKGELISSCL
jgi:midasin